METGLFAPVAAKPAFMASFNRRDERGELQTEWINLRAKSKSGAQKEARAFGKERGWTFYQVATSEWYARACAGTETRIGIR